jgi:hypothetical protein
MKLGIEKTAMIRAIPRFYPIRDPFDAALNQAASGRSESERSLCAAPEWRFTTAHVSIHSRTRTKTSDNPSTRCWRVRTAASPNLSG